MLEGITFILILAVSLMAFAFASVFLFFHKKSWLFRCSLLALCCIPIAAFLWYWGPSDLTEPNDLRTAYREEFGKDPSEDVTSLQCRQIVVGDSGAAWLRFHASPATIDGLLSKFVPCDRAAFFQAGAGANTPAWWQPEKDKIVSYYRAEHLSRNFQRSEAVIGHGSGKQTVYFSHRGSD